MPLSVLCSEYSKISSAHSAPLHLRVMPFIRLDIPVKPPSHSGHNHPIPIQKYDNIIKTRNITILQ